jgi:hypothetical protein
MIDSITLFQKHTPNSGNICQFNCKNNSVYYLYSQKDLTEKDFKRLETIHKDDKPLEILHNLIQKKGGGLIIQAAEDINTQKTTLVMSCTYIPNKGYIPPEKWFILHPTGKRCEAKDINYGKTETYRSSSHIIIPVDKTHQEELSQFLNYLSWYTPDLESLVLHSIRNPLLETRVASLEENLEILKQKKTILNTLADSEYEKKWPFWFKPLSIGVVVTLLVAQLVISGMLLFYKYNEQKSLADTTTKLQDAHKEDKP